MPTAGSRLTVYEIVAQLGAGGMGEVYRAKDTKLGRDVALKILPATFTNDPERVARFRREAQVLASLNHPHIGQIYGLDEANGTQFLVLELVDGESLDKRIARGPIPVEDALGIAEQIAEVLEAAHEKGIIHRDLKPANIALTTDGNVKVLDFGLAKAVETTASPSNLSMSPTITTPAMMTGVGTVLGTAAYMSPEQAKGRPADRRSDTWAFGCVLYEMLTGQRAFGGDDVSETLANVLKTEPDWDALPLATSPVLRRLLSHCLKKDSKNRLQAIGDARIEIGELLSGGPEPIAGAWVAPARLGWRRLVIAGITLFFLAALTGVIGWFSGRSMAARPRVSRLAITPQKDTALSVNGIGRDVAITPDGSRLVYVGANATTLFVRPLDQLEPTPLVRGAALRVRDPFVSPDGEWVGFFDGPVTMKKVAITGGPTMQVAGLDSSGLERGATWTSDGMIIFATTTGGLQRVSADGGTPAVLTRLDRSRGEVGHLWPEPLPGGRAILYTVRAETGLSIALLDLRSGRSTILLRGGSHAQYVPSGHLVYATAGTLRAVGFDLTRMITVGPSTPIVQQVMTSTWAAVEAAISRDGTFAYVPGAGSGVGRTLVWVDRQGREIAIGAPPRAYLHPRISPDGTRIAVATGQGLWIWDLARATLTRLAPDAAGAQSPVWISNSRLVFSSIQAGGRGLFSQAADGTGSLERLLEDPNAPETATGVSSDGSVLVLAGAKTSGDSGSDVSFNVGAMRLDGSRQVRPLLGTLHANNGMLSPDGRWLTYQSNDSGTTQVFVRPYPAVNSGRWQVSTNGGTQPLWAHDGQELFYLASDGALMRVSVGKGLIWAPSAPTKVFERRYYVGSGFVGGNPFRNYDVSADGQRFLMMKAGSGDEDDTYPQQIVVVQHFDEELKRIVPTK
jgi:serine/threonine-protein kinase